MNFLLNWITDNPYWTPLLAVTAIALLGGMIGQIFNKVASVKYCTLFAAFVGTMVCPVIWLLATMTGQGVYLTIATNQPPPEETPALADSVWFPATESEPLELAYSDGLVAEAVAGSWSLPEIEAEPRVPASPPQRGRVQRDWAQAAWDLPVVLLLTWSCGTAIGLFGLMSAAWRLRQLLRTVKPIDRRRFRLAIRQAANNLGLKDYPRLGVTDRIDAPAAVGSGGRVWVLLPKRYLNKVTHEQLVHVLTHEGAHVIRRDPLVQWAQRLSIAVWWWHPVMHLLNRQLSRAREEVCDNVVLSTTNSHDYGTTLLELGKLISNSSKLATSVSLFGSSWKLEHRIKGLLNPRRRTMKVHRTIFALTLVTSVGLSALLSTTRIQAQERDRRDRERDTVVEDSPERADRDRARETARPREARVAMQQLEHMRAAHAHLREAGLTELAVAVERRMQALHRSVGDVAEAAEMRRRSDRPDPAQLERLADEAPTRDRRARAELERRDQVEPRRPNMAEPPRRERADADRRSAESRRAESRSAESRRAESRSAESRSAERRDRTDSERRDGSKPCHQRSPKPNAVNVATRSVVKRSLGTGNRPVILPAAAGQPPKTKSFKRQS